MPGMDQRELESRVKALTKVVAANEPPENALKLLESLKKDASPTEEMLRVRLILSPFFAAVLQEQEGNAWEWAETSL